MLKLMVALTFITIILTSSLNANSPWLGRDKTMHLLGSAYLVYWNYHLNEEVFGYSPANSLLLSVSLTSTIGTGKELSDRYIKRTRFSWYDMAYNAAGVVLGVIVIRATK